VDRGEGDIKACFDEISHSAPLDRVRRRIGDKRILALAKAFLKAGILGEDGELRDSSAGAPQGGILSPVLSNVALAILEEHFAKAWKATGDTHDRERRRRKGLANYRMVRYADHWVVMVAGTRGDAERLRGEAAEVLLPMGLRLSEEKTKIVHIDQGFDFLGMRIQRHQKQGATKCLVYTYPARKALASVKAKVRDITANRYTNQTLAVAGRGEPLQPGRYLSGWWPTQDGVSLFNPGAAAIVRYRYRATGIPSPWAITTKDRMAPATA
jgi:RNA-directed DNA polymerase